MLPTYPQEFFQPTLRQLETAFRRLEKLVPTPQRKPWGDDFVFRYAEQSIQQAIVQKLARTISGLYAINVLLDRGLFQEQGMVQRGLDELEEDVLFLSLAVTGDDVTELHKKYLEYFYAEEFGEPDNVWSSHSSRGMISRQKIRAYINRSLGENEARGNIAGRILAKTYSGFVHAASPHIMDMCIGDPPNFDVSGRHRIWKTDIHAQDALNYFYRGLTSMASGAKALGDEDLFLQLYATSNVFYANMKALLSSRSGEHAAHS